MIYLRKCGGFNPCLPCIACPTPSGDIQLIADGLLEELTLASPCPSWVWPGDTDTYTHYAETPTQQHEREACLGIPLADPISLSWVFTSTLTSGTIETTVTMDKTAGSPDIILGSSWTHSLSDPGGVGDQVDTQSSGFVSMSGALQQFQVNVSHYSSWGDYVEYCPEDGIDETYRKIIGTATVSFETLLV